jgi:hypothetical protein
MKKFHELTRKYDKVISEELQNYFKLVNITSNTQKSLINTLEIFDLLILKYPDMDINELSTNPIESFFSLIKKKNVYPNSLEFIKSVTKYLNIIEILLSKQIFNFDKFFISRYYSLQILHPNFFINNLLNNIYKPFPEIEYVKPSLETILLLNKNKPQQGKLSLRNQTTKTNITLYLCCPFIINGCNHFWDFKVVTCLCNHLHKDHNIDKIKAKEVAQKMINFSLNQYENKMKNLKSGSFNDDILILNKDDVKIFYEELIMKPNTENNDSETQIIEITKKRKRDMICINCKIKKSLDCLYCAECCRKFIVKCNFHKSLISNLNLKKLQVEDFTIIVHDFEFVKGEKGKIENNILEYSAIKLKNNYENEVLIDTLIFPTKKVDFNCYALKNVCKIDLNDLEQKSILLFELLKKLNEKLDENVIFISSACSNELMCFKSIFNTMDNNEEISDVDLKKYENLIKIKENLNKEEEFNDMQSNQLLELKKNLAKKKEKNYQNLFTNRKIIFLDSGIFFKNIDKVNPRNQQDLFELILNDEDYQEKHRSFNDCDDLIKIIVKQFPNYKDLTNSIIKFLGESKSGIWIYGDLNKINK